MSTTANTTLSAQVAIIMADVAVDVPGVVTAFGRAEVAHVRRDRGAHRLGWLLDPSADRDSGYQREAGDEGVAEVHLTSPRCSGR